MAPQILPSEDTEVSAQIQSVFKKQGIDLYLGTQVVEVEKSDENVQVTCSDGTTIVTDKVLVSVGRHINPQGLGLENAGVAVGNCGEITVNEYLETTAPGIYAIGDVTGKSMLAHVASYHGKVAVENMMGNLIEINDDVIPVGIFTVPEIGRVGITEEEAKTRGIQTRIGRFRPIGLGKAHAQGETTGLFKVIADAESDRLLGVHIVGSHAADLIHEAALGMRLGATAKTLATTIHAHPTWAEGLMEAAEDVSGEAIHLAKKKVAVATP
jgi:dihydrolipoamide dehydrogenase